MCVFFFSSFHLCLIIQQAMAKDKSTGADVAKVLVPCLVGGVLLLAYVWRVGQILRQRAS